MVLAQLMRERGTDAEATATYLMKKGGVTHDTPP